MFVLCLLRKINLQVKLKLFVVTKPTLYRTICFAWTHVLLAMWMLFYLDLKNLYCLFHASAEEAERNDKDADQYDSDIDTQSNDYCCLWKCWGSRILQLN